MENFFRGVSSLLLIVVDLTIGCYHSIGLSSHPNHQFYASSYQINFRPESANTHGGIINKGCWKPQIDDRHPWIMVDLATNFHVTGFAFANTAQPSKRFTIHVETLEEYSNIWKDGDEYEFQHGEMKKVAIKAPFFARWLKFNVLMDGNSKETCFKVQLFGCKVCTKPIGVSKVKFKPTQFTSSSYQKFREPYKARLNGTSCWSPKNRDRKPWIAVDFKEAYFVTSVSLQGPPRYLHNTGMLNRFTLDIFDYFQEKWNVGKTGWFGPSWSRLDTTHVVLPDVIAAQKIRVNPILYKNDIPPCIRVEVNGCLLKPQIDYCAVNNTCDPNNQICQSGVDRAICSCKPGFQMKNGVCEDINECTKGSDRCDPLTALCENTIGSYKCKCNHDGLKLDRFGKKCIDRNECQENNGGCDHRCTNLIKRHYKCSCYDGYVLAQDGHTCNDINECLSSNNRCDNQTSTCINQPGSYKCQCLTGLKTKVDTSKKFICEDINECDTMNGKCDHECHNTFQSYYCSCRQNTELNADGKRCDDINECTRGTHDCEQVCVNRYAGYSCRCNEGYKLQADEKSCKDIDECASNNGRGPCEHHCKNTPGSFQCSCNKGYKLSSDKKACVDVDECVDRLSKCDHATSTCVNTQGSYECRCRPGYIKSSSGECIAKKCPAFPSLLHGSISPPDCSSANAKQFKDVCSFKCDAGYKLNVKSAKLAFCNENGKWDLRSKQIPICEKIRCGATAVVSNGEIVPTSCKTVGAKFGESCTLYCNNGFRLKGASAAKCTETGSYDVSFSNSQCVKKRKITCPADVAVVLPLGASDTALPLAKLTVPLDVDKYITEPAGVLDGTHKFQAQLQSHSVKLKYKDSFALDSDTESCVFHVKVLDREPPKVKNCPADNVYITINSATGKVTWKEPEFSDNVGIIKQIQNTRNNQILPQQVYFVLYEVSDAYGNEASCRFFVHVKAKYCDKNTIPGGNDANIIPFGSHSPAMLKIFVNCPPSKTYSQNLTTAGIFDCKSGVWKGAPIPDCVPFSDKTGACTDGEQTLMMLNKKIVCGKCPKGTMGKDGKCISCKKGFYQDEVGKITCSQCVKGTTTLKEGAKGANACQALCQPGTYSLDGFYGASGCQRCPGGSYQDEIGQTSCKLCPNGAQSFKGSTSEKECLSPPHIVKIIPSSESVVAKVGETIIVECYATGTPKPHLSFDTTKTLPPANFRGKKTIQPISTVNNDYGLRMMIEKTQTYDSAIYRCIADNRRGPLGGFDEREIYIKVVN